MESYKPYNIQGGIRPECFKNAKEWTAPTGDEIKLVLAMANWSGVEFAKRIHANDRTVRRWIGNELKIPHSQLLLPIDCWLKQIHHIRCLCVSANLDSH